MRLFCYESAGLFVSMSVLWTVCPCLNKISIWIGFEKASRFHHLKTNIFIFEYLPKILPEKNLRQTFYLIEYLYKTNLILSNIRLRTQIYLPNLLLVMYRIGFFRTDPGYRVIQHHISRDRYEKI